MIIPNKNHVNVALTPKVLAETRWFVIDAESGRIPSGVVFTQVLASPNLPDVLLAKTERGDSFWYDDVLYATADPNAMRALFKKWNKDHGHAH